VQSIVRFKSIDYPIGSVKFIVTLGNLGCMHGGQFTTVVFAIHDYCETAFKFFKILYHSVLTDC